MEVVFGMGRGIFSTLKGAILSSQGFCGDKVLTENSN
jgi:hypothetical protein